MFHRINNVHFRANYPLMALQFPTDPAHVEQLKIKLNSTYIQFCCSLGPCQPVAGFPKNPQGRSFQSQWYAGNNWLEYSVEKDAMYCFSCRLFLTEDKFKARTAWRTTGVVNWRKAVEKIHEHAATEAHMISMVRWANYRKGPFVEAFKAQAAECELQNEKERQKNREILFRLIDITVYLARQGLAFRGHDESSTSSNRGNFLELVHLLAEYDSVLRMHLECIQITQSQKKKPQVTLLSNRTQNDLIRSLGTQVRNVILKEIKEAKIFSILLDETTDVSQSEQVSFVVRFFHDMQIKERFIQVCQVKSTTGQDLEEVVMALLSENGLNAENIRGQGYDGAANMSASYKGLQARLQRQNEKALFVHCHAHCLNLVLV